MPLEVKDYITTYSILRAEYTIITASHV